jgi:hypothetical protein
MFYVLLEEGSWNRFEECAKECANKEFIHLLFEVG